MCTRSFQQTTRRSRWALPQTEGVRSIILFFVAKVYDGEGSDPGIDVEGAVQRVVDHACTMPITATYSLEFGSHINGDIFMLQAKEIEGLGGERRGLQPSRVAGRIRPRDLNYASEIAVGDKPKLVPSHKNLAPKEKLR